MRQCQRHKTGRRPAVRAWQRQAISTLGLWLAASVFCLGSLPASAKTFTYRVRHLHAIGSCQGKLVVSETDVRYESGFRDHARIWPYLQLKKVASDTPRRLTFFTYEDQTLQLGRDRPFNFELLDGNVSDELFNFLQERVGRGPAPPPAATPPGGRFELAVKHLHLFGGCEGTLRITPNFLQYVTAKESDARLWKYLDIKRIESRSPYRMNIHTYEDQLLLLGRDRVFRFELKEVLEPAVLEFMRARMGK